VQSDIFVVMMAWS